MLLKFDPPIRVAKLRKRRIQKSAKSKYFVPSPEYQLKPAAFFKNDLEPVTLKKLKKKCKAKDRNDHRKVQAERDLKIFVILIEKADDKSHTQDSDRQFKEFFESFQFRHLKSWIIAKVLTYSLFVKIAQCP